MRERSRFSTAQKKKKEKKQTMFDRGESALVASAKLLSWFLCRLFQSFLMHDGRFTQQETVQMSSIHPLRTEIRRFTQQDYSGVRKIQTGIVAVVNKSLTRLRVRTKMWVYVSGRHC